MEEDARNLPAEPQRVTTSTNRMAVFSLASATAGWVIIFGLSSCLLVTIGRNAIVFILWFPLPALAAFGTILLCSGIVAIFTGYEGRSQIRETGQQGRGLIFAGLTTGYLQVALSMVFFFLLIKFLLSSPRLIPMG
jgi:Domain of unknown function (DUF4190)